MDVLPSEEEFENIVHTIFEKHWIYTFTHVLAGVVSVWYPFLGILFLAYQLLQLAFNKRFFLFTMEFKEENNPRHTAMKVAEFGTGFFGAWLWKKW